MEDFPLYAYSNEYHNRMTPNNLFGSDRTFVFEDASVIDDASRGRKILGPTLNEQMVVIASSKSLARPILDAFQRNDKVFRTLGGGTADKVKSFKLVATEHGGAVLENT